MNGVDLEAFRAHRGASSVTAKLAWYLRTIFSVIRPESESRSTVTSSGNSCFGIDRIAGGLVYRTDACWVRFVNGP